MSGRDELQSFLSSSRGGRDLSLTDEESLFGQYVYAVAKEECEKQEKEFNYEVKAVSAKEKLYEIVTLLKKCENAKILFLGNFDVWQERRIKTLQKIRAITNVMTSKRCNCLAAQSIPGGCNCIVASLSAWISSLPGASLVAYVLSAVGSLFRLVGVGDTLVSVGASIKDTCLLNKTIHEAKDVCKKEKIFFNLMNKLFENAQELICAVEYIIGFNLVREICHDIEQMYAEARNMNCNSSEYNDKVKSVITRNVQKMCKSKNFTTRIEFTVAPVVITFLLIRCMMDRKNMFLINCVLTIIRSTVPEAALDEAVVDFTRVFEAVSSLRNERESAPCDIHNYARVAFRDGLFNFGIALDNALLILNSCDGNSIRQGSESEQAIGIKEVANQLETELCILKELYGNFNQV